MDSEVREVLLGVQNGSMSVDQALLHLKQKPGLWQTGIMDLKPYMKVIL